MISSHVEIQKKIDSHKHGVREKNSSHKYVHKHILSKATKRSQEVYMLDEIFFYMFLRRFLLIDNFMRRTLLLHKVMRRCLHPANSLSSTRNVRVCYCGVPVY
jgi:hypothetical protein